MVDQSTVKNLRCFVVDAETEASLRSIPFSQHGIEMNVEIGDVMSAVSYLKENRSPDILLIDVTKSSFPTSGLDLLADVCEPGVEVIAIGERNEVGVYRDLIRSGVHDYFVKPLPVQPLLKCIDGITKRGTLPEGGTVFHKTGKVVAVIGAVGGIGASTIVSNLGWGLTEKRQKRVALIDMDFHLGTIADSLNVEITENIHQLFSTPERIDDILVERFMAHINDNFMVLGSQTPLDNTNDYKEESLESVVNVLTSKFHYVIIDVPRNFTISSTTDILKRADFVILVTDYSISGLKTTNKLFNMLKSFVSIGQRILLVANKTGAYTQGEIDRNQFEERLPQPIDIEIPFDRKEPMQYMTNGEQIISTGTGELASGITRIMNNLSGVSSATLEKPTGNIFQILFNR